MSLFQKKKILVTHNDRFHTDDIFATAALSILLKGNIKVIRSRDPQIIKHGDYVYDVGEEYDPARNRFDHHQKGGAGVRPNGIPYAAFGLVWKTYGEQLCGSKEVAKKIDQELVQAVDAHDNGISLYTLKTEVAPYLIESMFGSLRPTWSEKPDFDTPFLRAVEIAKEVLLRIIFRSKESFRGKAFVDKIYHDTEDKRIIILDGPYPWSDVLIEHPEPLYVVWPRLEGWGVGCVGKERHSFENRKSLPRAWAGLRDGDLAKVSGVSDAVFCHNACFLAVAKSKEGAVALAQKALVA